MQLRFLIKLLRLHQPARFVFVLFAVMGSALVDTFGIAMIMPFMALTQNPKLIELHRIFSKIYELSGCTSQKSFLILFGMFVLCLLVVSNSFNLFANWFSLRFVWGKNFVLSKMLLTHYLSQPYSFYLSRNSSDLVKNVLGEVLHIIQGVLVPFMLSLGRMAVVLFIFLLLLSVDPVLAVTSLGVLGGVYAFIFITIRKKLARQGTRRTLANEKQYRVVNEVFGAIKDVKLMGKESIYLNQFEMPASVYAETIAKSQALGMFPKNLMEMLAFGGILLIVLYLLAFRADTSGALPLIALYAFAGYRLMPALQIIFQGVTNIKFNQSAIENFRQQLIQAEGTAFDLNLNHVDPLLFTNRIELKNIIFKYPVRTEPALKKLNLTIQKNQTIGLVGATGSGKTTAVDLLLGLLIPSDGAIYVDDVQLDDQTRPRWQKLIGYVPQFIYLSDDSVEKNIAFGIPEDQIDHQAVEQAARMANLHEFVSTQLPQGYKTIVGERGIRLSGGQRQRIGIARALYHNPQVLIMDEATSALDGITEQAVMDAIKGLSHQKTIVLIAHRLTTVKDCDQIYRLEKGEVVEQGTFEELLKTSEAFRLMASQSNG